jgi:hypothetical protein
MLMQNYKNILTILGVLAAAALVGGAIGWLGGRTSEQPLPPAAVVSSPPVEAAGVETVAASKPAVPAVPVATTTSPNAAVPSPSHATNWNEVVQAIVESDAADADKAKKLFDLFPSLPPETQVAVVENLSELVSDPNYAPLGQLLKNAKLPAPVLDGLMGDALGRPDSVKLPLMLELARNPSHAKASEAKDILETYLGKDYGSDWAQWQQHLAEWLKANPD